MYWLDQIDMEYNNHANYEALFFTNANAASDAVKRYLSSNYVVDTDTKQFEGVVSFLTTGHNRPELKIQTGEMLLNDVYTTPEKYKFKTQKSMTDFFNATQASIQGLKTGLQFSIPHVKSQMDKFRAEVVFNEIMKRRVLNPKVDKHIIPLLNLVFFIDELSTNKDTQDKQKIWATKLVGDMESNPDKYRKYGANYYRAINTLKDKIAEINLHDPLAELHTDDNDHEVVVIPDDEEEKKPEPQSWYNPLNWLPGNRTPPPERDPPPLLEIPGNRTPPPERDPPPLIDVSDDERTDMSLVPQRFDNDVTPITPVDPIHQIQDDDVLRKPIPPILNLSVDPIPLLQDDVTPIPQILNLSVDPIPLLQDDVTPITPVDPIPQMQDDDVLRKPIPPILMLQDDVTPITPVDPIPQIQDDDVLPSWLNPTPAAAPLPMARSVPAAAPTPAAAPAPMARPTPAAAIDHATVCPVCNVTITQKQWMGGRRRRTIWQS